jgi:hypothetical protein
MNLKSHALFYRNSEINSAVKTDLKKPDTTLKYGTKKKVTNNFIASNAEVKA